MALITLEKASLSFGKKILLNKVSLGIEHNDKIGLIGRNGSGKSSTLKSLAGELELDSGFINIARDTKIVYVAQEPQLNPNNTIFEEVFNQIQINQSQIKKSNNLLIDEDNSSWIGKNLVDIMLTELNLNKNLIIHNLSGGSKKKVALAKALITHPDVLLLDEPTNHLDIDSTVWLERMIHNFTGCVIFITHDRKFLDNVANKIIELDRGNLSVYPGSFEKYQEWKTQQLAIEDKNNHEFDKILAQEEAWIRQGIEARRTRNEGRVKRLEQLRIQRKNRNDKLGRVNFRLERGNLSGKTVAKINNISLKFGETTIIKNFTTQINRGDKIGLIGGNGIGKSTLIKVILGEIKPDSGFCQLGDTVELAYFDQFREQLDEDASIAEVINQGQDFIEINGKKIHIVTYLQDFLFSPEQFRVTVKSLSGGERNRLLLARLFSRPANVIVLDEPTNDLDIETLELLEDLLTQYQGTIFLVSHDRAFLDNVVTSSYVFLGNGEILQLTGGYSDWLNYQKTLLAPRHNNRHNTHVKLQKPVAIADITIDNDQLQNQQPQNQQLQSQQPQSQQLQIKRKLSYKEKLELEALPKDIKILEVEQIKLQQELTDVNLYKENPQLAKQYTQRLSELDTIISNKMERWLELENF